MTTPKQPELAPPMLLFGPDPGSGLFYDPCFHQLPYYPSKPAILRLLDVCLNRIGTVVLVPKNAKDKVMSIRSSVPHLIFALMITVVPVLNVAAQDTPPAEDIDAKIQQLSEQGHFPGVAIAVMQAGEPVYVGTHGMANLADSVPVASNTVFEIASLTKQMTALAITTLVEQGHFTLDDRIAEWIPDPPEAWAQVTVNQLLSHMGGFVHGFEQKVDDQYLLEYSRENMLASAKNAPMIAQPGEDWNYSDLGYFLLGMIIESTTQKTYAEYMQSMFFRPLGMEQTHLLDQRRIVPHLARGYAWNDGKLERNRRVWQFALTSHFGVMSSLDDMMRWEAALVDSEVINHAALQSTWEIQRTFSTGDSCDRWGYGRGWHVAIVDGKRVLNHGGYAGTAYIRFIDTGLAVIVLTNREDNPNELSPISLAWAIANAFDAEIPVDGYRCWE
ncbi:MAG: serine hydrolase domain-containing protein [Pseudomonadota bacterium]